jgi:hypothetical protein
VLRMRIFLCLVLPLFLLSGCFKTSETESPPVVAPTLNLQGWKFLAKIQATYASDSSSVPTNVYVFPALRLNGNGQPIDVLSHRMDDSGALQWFSPAPRAGEIQSVIEKKLTTKGFRVISFQDLLNFPKSHSVLVFNPYFTEARWSDGNADKGVPEGWSTFTRVTASTYPMDLNPAEKRDIIQQELVSLFKEQSNAPDVVKRSLVYSIDHIGQNREWSESISLLK